MEASAEPPSFRLLAAGDEHDRQGRSLRAEQYYLAALEAGAPPGEVLPRLVGTCLRSGRLQSALIHVETELERHPDDEPLALLAEALRTALERRTGERKAS